jgi:glycosyltransferase involved in cell wall biosynthesis
VVETGTFLDINSTIHYKNSQMMVISKMFHNKEIRDGDVFFFADLEFWGLESLRLMAAMNKVNIKICGFLHAGSYTIEDAFAVASPYQRYTEVGWVACCDAVFVGSHYHADSVITRRLKAIAPDSKEDGGPDDWMGLANKVLVTGNPVFASDYKEFPYNKKYQLILPNRFDWEKRPNIALDIAVVLKQRNPGLEILVTTSRPEFRSNKKWLVDYARTLESAGIIKILSGLSKDEYHRHLSESRVMLTTSIEENFGYCIAEALFYNTPVVAANKFSHPELLGNNRMLYNDEDEIIEKVEWFLHNEDFDVRLDDKYLHAMDCIIDSIKELI